MNKEEAKKRISQALEIKARDDSNIIGLPYVSWVETADKIDAIIDSLTIDNQKVKLPREVIDELNDWQSDHQDGYTGKINELCGAMWDEDPDLPTVIDFAEKSEENYLKVIDAYRYGWEAEQEAKWYVKAPESWKAASGDLNWLYKPSYGGVSRYNHTGGSDEQFTRAEIKQYHLDSDIFTKIKCDEND